MGRIIVLSTYERLTIVLSPIVLSPRVVAGARFELVALAIHAAACAAIARGACIGAIGLGALVTATATVDCDNCVVREDSPDNLERIHTP
jgi:hypothetical protein